MKLSRNYLIAVLLLIALYLMFFRARASGYAPGRAPRGSQGMRDNRTEYEAAMDRLHGYP